jgi:hypothetical protein
MDISQFPTGIDRENLILDSVQNSKSEYYFNRLVINDGKNEGWFDLFQDALKIQGVRVNTSAYIQQKLADYLDSSLLTAKLYDEMFIAVKNKITPSPRPITETTLAMIQHSKDVDSKLSKAGYHSNDGFAGSVGKTWIIDNGITGIQSCNYGWHFLGDNFQGIGGGLSKIGKLIDGKPLKLIQTCGYAHNVLYRSADYSQICLLVSNRCFVNGVQYKLKDVFSHPEYSKLVNYGGVLKVLRQPGV